MKLYYYLDSNNEVNGPLVGKELIQFLSEGTIELNTMIAEENSQQWEPLKDSLAKFISQEAVVSKLPPVSKSDKIDLTNTIKNVFSKPKVLYGIVGFVLFLFLYLTIGRTKIPDPNSKEVLIELTKVFTELRGVEAEDMEYFGVHIENIKIENQTKDSQSVDFSFDLKLKECHEIYWEKLGERVHATAYYTRDNHKLFVRPKRIKNIYDRTRVATPVGGSQKAILTSAAVANAFKDFYIEIRNYSIKHRHNAFPVRLSSIKLELQSSSKEVQKTFRILNPIYFQGINRITSPAETPILYTPYPIRGKWVILSVDGATNIYNSRKKLNKALAPFKNKPSIICP